MVGCVDSYTIDNRIISIPTASVIELRMIYEDMDKKKSTNNLTIISDSEREKQMGKNLYSPNNQIIRINTHNKQ